MMKIRDLARWNPWWKGVRESSEYLSDYFKHTFLSLRKLAREENFVVRGPRQVGKTEFLFRNIIELIRKNVRPENITYISCDRIGGLGELRSTVRELQEVLKVQEGKKFLLLDEITSIRDWHKAVKEFCEEGFFTVYATGSRPKELETKAEYFPGRAKILNFYPLSFREFCISFFSSLQQSNISLPELVVNKGEKWQKLVDFAEKLGIKNLGLAEKVLKELNAIKLGLINLKESARLYKYFEIFDSLFRIYLKVGGYPSAMEAFIQQRSLPFDLVVKDTLGTIEKEGLSLDVLNRLLPRLLESTGNKIEYAKLAREIEADPATAMRYIHTLERSFLVREIYYFNGKIRPTKGKKIFFSDPFIIKALENYYGVKEVDETKIVESVVVETIARNIEDPFRRLAKSWMGFGMLKGKEVDIILSKPKKLRIEVKYGKVFERKNIDVILTKDTLEISEKPFKIPVSLFLLTLNSKQVSNLR